MRKPGVSLVVAAGLTLSWLLNGVANADTVLPAGSSDAAQAGSSSPSPGASPNRQPQQGADKEKDGKKKRGGIHKIEHVVVIMQENRSFDHYFGTFPGADGLPRRSGDSQLLGLRPPVRPAGPHVRAECVLESARAPVHGVWLVSEVQQRQPDELQERAPEPGQRSVRVDRPDLSAQQSWREMGVLRGWRDATRL